MVSPGFIPHACPVEGTVEIALQLLESYNGQCPLCKTQLLPPSEERWGYSYPKPSEPEKG